MTKFGWVAVAGLVACGSGPVLRQVEDCACPDILGFESTAACREQPRSAELDACIRDAVEEVASPESCVDLLEGTVTDEIDTCYRIEGCAEGQAWSAVTLCTYTPPEGIETQYCPGDNWGAGDGCNSCGCGQDGEVICTQQACG